MRKIRLGIIREGKTPMDKRVPFTPRQARDIMKKFPHVKVVCQHSRVRCFKDEEYTAEGISIVTDIFDCDILMGIKEVPVSNLIGGRIYLFFSHTIKMQPHNRRLLQTVLKKKIQLIDYEALKDKKGNRLVAFGRYAGLVGAYNSFLVYGQRYRSYAIRRAFQCTDFYDLETEFPKIKLPALKIILTGTGRVGKGATEILTCLGIKKVGVQDFLNTDFDHPVYVQLTSSDYHIHKEGKEFDRSEFHEHPDNYESDFRKFAHCADLLIAGAFWDPRAPRLFTKEDMRHPDFKIKIIADISCDINGSIPATIKATDITNPVFDYNPFTEEAEPPYSSKKNITVMAVDNLPCELPRSASEDFGRDLLERVMPSLLLNDKDNIIERASLTRNGELLGEFTYLSDYVLKSTE